MVPQLYGSLLLWTDLNHNGVSEASELKPFRDQFASISLGYRDHHRRDGNGNYFAYEGWVFQRTKPGRNNQESGADADARRRKIYDVILATSN